MKLDDRIEQQIKQNKWVYAIISIVISIGLFYIYMMYAYRIGYNSDHAGVLIQAHDILQGNIFLKGWEGGTMNGLTTWHMVNVVSVFLFGLRDVAIYIAGASTYLALVITAILLTGVDKEKKLSYKNMFITLCLLIVPAGTYVNNMITTALHIEAYVIAILALIILNKIMSTEENGKYYLVFILMLFMANFGDEVTLYILSLPIICVMFFEYLKDKKKNTLNVLILSILVVGISIVLNKLFVKNGLLVHYSNGEKIYLEFENLIDNIMLTLQQYINYFNADIFGKPIFSIEGIKSLIGMLIFLMVSYSVIYTIRRYKEQNLINKILIVAILIQTLAYTFSNLCTENNARYLVPCVIYMCILSGRSNIYNLICNTINIKPLNKFLSLGITILMIIGVLTRIVVPPQVEQPIDKIANVLIENNLERGYATYWLSHSVTVASEGKVRVADIVYDSDNISQYRWMSKNSWYQEPANFVIVDRKENEGEAVGMYYNILGLPIQQIDIDDFSILIYDYDISTQLTDASGFDERTFTSKNLLYNENGSIEEKDIVLSKLGVQYGPYTPLKSGNYIVTIKGENLNSSTYDVFATNEEIPMTIIESSNDIIRYEISLSNKKNRVEFRTFNNSEEKVVVTEIMVQKK